MHGWWVAISIHGPLSCGAAARPFFMSPNLKKFVKSQKGGGGGDTAKP
jgi:hypothetical protein